MKESNDRESKLEKNEERGLLMELVNYRQLVKEEGELTIQ